MNDNIPLAALIAASLGLNTSAAADVEDTTTIPGEDTTYAEVIAFSDAQAETIHASFHNAVVATGFGPKTADRAEGMMIGNLVQKYLAENPDSLEGFAEYLDGILAVSKLASLTSLFGDLSRPN